MGKNLRGRWRGTLFVDSNNQFDPMQMLKHGFEKEIKKN
jgi:hypothetical protein